MKRAVSVIRSRPIRALFFDAGNTLLRMNYAAIADQLRRYGAAVTPESVAQAEYRARVRLDPHLAGRSTEGRSAAGRYLRYLLEGLGVTDEETIQSVAEWRRQYNPPVGLWHLPDPEAEPALRLARDAGCAAGVISNSNGSVRSILEDTGLAAHLDFILDSAVVGVEKPDPRIFQMGLDAAGVQPGEAVYIGDLYSVDVLGARGVGMEGVLLDPGGVWGERDCPLARTLPEAVAIALGNG